MSDPKPRIQIQTVQNGYIVTVDPDPTNQSVPGFAQVATTIEACIELVQNALTPPQLKH
jgi:hypothetical protein